MAETKNIDAVAGIISSRIFRELKWQSNKHTDLNWACCVDAHLKHNQKEKTHPTDVVFFYKDPYSDIYQYIQTDLKSYSKSTIESYQYNEIQKTIKSLAQQVDCSVRNTEWQDLFLNDKKEKFQVHGMLFIYNHDNEYDNNLLSKLSSILSSDLQFPLNSCLFILDPRSIRFLLSVTEDILKRRNYESFNGQVEEMLWEKIPAWEECGFFYPDKHNKLASKDRKLPATLEMITSGMLFFQYSHDFIRDHNGAAITNKLLNIYWEEEIDREEQFVFLIEYIFNYQLLSQFDKIFIVTPFSCDSTKYLDSAIKTYSKLYSFTLDKLNKLKGQLHNISIDSTTSSIFPFRVISKDVKKLCDFSGDVQ
nr:MAG TPA: hypothetical protein [Caudoviricetes sp.]